MIRYPGWVADSGAGVEDTDLVRAAAVFVRDPEVTHRVVRAPA